MRVLFPAPHSSSPSAKAAATTLLVMLSCASLVTVSVSQRIPNSVCTGLEFVFKSLGCLEQETRLCRFLAILFTTHTSTGGVWCDKFLCDGGYGQSPFDTECTNSCNVGNLRPRGICPSSETCCSIERLRHS